MVLAVFLCASTLLFSGCFEDEKVEAGETFFERYVDGVSTVYADMDGQDTSGNQIIDNLGDLIVNSIDGLLGNYGNGKYEYVKTIDGKTITSTLTGVL